MCIRDSAYSEQEPSTGGGEIPETINKISEIIAPGDYTVQGTVSACLLYTSPSGAA